MRRCLCLLAAVLPWACALGSEPPSVGTLTQHNALAAHGALRMKTPSILHRVETRPPAADALRALQHYERLLALDPPAALRAEALRRSADLRVQRADAGEDQRSQELRLAVAYYRELRTRHAGHAPDRVLYQLARAQLLLGDTPGAIDSLRELAQAFPQSPRAADARFRSAELLYAARRYAEAETQYRTLLATAPEGPQRQLAQYKLGWSLHQLGRHEDALAPLLAVLDRELPAGTLDDPAAALAQLEGRRGAQAELAADALRVTTLQLAALGGGGALKAYFERNGPEPRFAALLYAALGERLLAQRRYAEAAASDAAFIAAHPRHALAPRFQLRAIDACTRGGFAALALHAREAFVTRFAPDASYWSGRALPAAHLEHLREQLDALGRHHYAAAQAAPTAQQAAAFARTAGWLRRRVEWFEADAGRAAAHLLYADALLNAGERATAAAEYEQVAYDYDGFAHAAQAAFAALQALRRHANAATGAARAVILRQSIESGRRLIAAFPAHPQRAAVWAAASGDYLELGEAAAAIQAAQHVLAEPAVDTALREEVLAVIADAHFAGQGYVQAEAAYLAVLRAAPGSAATPAWRERLATAIYRQGEEARAAGDLQAAADAFQRVGQRVPDSPIRASADVDAAAALIARQDWRAAQRLLEALRAREPGHALAVAADHKLAYAYEQDRQPARAAPVFQRIARRDSEAPALRRDAAWRAAELYDAARLQGAAQAAFEEYVRHYPQPLDPAQQARQRLAELAAAAGQDERHRDWLQQIVTADAGATDAGPVSKALAAQASLQIGRLQSAQLRQLALTLPLDRSLPRRTRATREAVATLIRAAAYGFDDVASAATYELGLIYRDFGRALLRSPRPAQLDALQREQYEVLLEEQAFPFEEKAIEALELNLERLQAGRWDDAIRRSAWVLAELAPARYGKHETREASYDAVD